MIYKFVVLFTWVKILLYKYLKVNYYVYEYVEVNK